VSLQASDQLPEPATAYWKRTEAMPEPASLVVALRLAGFVIGETTGAKVTAVGALLSIRRAVTVAEVVTLATPSVAMARKS
jgi:hypothetical protein